MIWVLEYDFEQQIPESAIWFLIIAVYIVSNALLGI